MSTLDAEIEQQLVDAAIDEIRANPRSFLTGDADVDGALASPMRVSEATGDRKVLVYHTLTGEARAIRANTLRETLQKRLPDGRRAFSTNPTVQPVVGNVKCYLHPEHPDREKWYRMGITTTCDSGHFASVVDMEAQMANKHSREWARMKDLLERERQQEDRDFQRQMLQAMTGRAPQVTTSTGTGIAATVVEIDVSSNADKLDVTDSATYLCAECGMEFPKAQGLAMHKRHKHSGD